MTWLAVGVTAGCLFLSACGDSEEGMTDPRVFIMAEDGAFYPVEYTVHLVVDGNRDGIVNVEDPEDLAKRIAPGGLFLANIDDDGGRCGRGPDDEELHRCSDANLDEVANAGDLVDLARFKIAPLPDVTPRSIGRLSIDEGSLQRVRIYRNVDGEQNPESFRVFSPGEDQLSANELRQGVEFAIEGLELIEDAAVWDGTVELTFELEVPETGKTFSDQAIMRQAPVLLRHHMDRATVVYAANLGSENREFRRDLNRAAEAAEVPQGTRWLNTWDPWTQDYFENGYMSIPGPDGPVVIQVYFRSPNISYPESVEAVFSRIYQGRLPAFLREAGALVHTDLSGPGVSGRSIFDPDKGYDPVDISNEDVDDIVRYVYGQRSTKSYPEVAQLIQRVMESDTLDSFGNTETIPPHVAPDGTKYPHGRIIRGRGADPEIRPDTSLTTLFESQGAQPTVWVETDWLIVAHVDETLSFVQSNTERGWSVLYGDPVQAQEMLQELRSLGEGERLLFQGLWTPDYDCNSWNCPDLPAQRTVNQVLDDTALMAASARAAVEIAAQKEVLIEEVGLRTEDFVGIPFLIEGGVGGHVAYQPGIVNGISLRPDFFGAPKPFGPVIDGRDIFEVRVEEILGEIGVQVEWIEAWDVYHVGLGEVHCGSNVERADPVNPWWTKEN